MSASGADYDYARAIVAGYLESVDRLRVGSGFDEPQSQADGDDSPLFASLCKAASGDPYLPGSTLRGFLRDRCAGAQVSEQVRDRLFGTGRKRLDPNAPEEKQDPGNAGSLRVYDARWVPGQEAAPGLRSRIEIEPITRTAKAHCLFTEELLPPGSLFDCRFELVRVSAGELDGLLALLRAAFDGRSDGGLGAGRSRRQGRLVWEGCALRVAVLDRDAYRAWLLGDAPIADCFTTRVETWQVEDRSAVTGRLADGALRLCCRLLPQAPLLVGERPSSKAEGAPDLAFLRAGNQAIVPSSSLKGVLRHQARRILLTMLEARNTGLADEALRKIADRLIGCIFGDTDRMGLLRVGEARGAYTAGDVHRQFFNAIDRFTGGVAEGRLYNVEAAIPEALRFEVVLDPRLVNKPWALGLLAYLLRDAMEGDLSIGWGRARGYGAVRVAVETLKRLGSVRRWGRQTAALGRLDPRLSKVNLERALAALDGVLDCWLKRAARLGNKGGLSR